MTNAELIQKIRNEIERRKGYISVTHFAEELLSFLSTIEPEKPMNQEGLEEEIREYMSNDDNNPYDWDWRDKRDCARHFAQWQKEQDDKLVDTIYQQGIEKGKDDMKEQMLKDAVEGKIGDSGFHNAVCLQKPKWTNILDGFKKGDKVRIIIVKEDKK